MHNTSFLDHLEREPERAGREPARETAHAGRARARERLSEEAAYPAEHAVEPLPPQSPLLLLRGGRAARRGRERARCRLGEPRRRTAIGRWSEGRLSVSGAIRTAERGRASRGRGSRRF